MVWNMLRDVLAVVGALSLVSIIVILIVAKDSEYPNV